jgi:hypothetical protein
MHTIPTLGEAPGVGNSVHAYNQTGSDGWASERHDISDSDSEDGNIGGFGRAEHLRPLVDGGRAGQEYFCPSVGG